MGTQGSNNMYSMAFIIFMIFVCLGDVLSLGSYTYSIVYLIVGYGCNCVFEEKPQRNHRMDSLIVIRGSENTNLRSYCPRYCVFTLGIMKQID